MQRFITDERTGIQYELIGDYYYPCLTIENEEPPTLTKYGRMRERYLREHRKILYINLLTSGKLYEHLADIDTSTCDMAEYLIKEMARKQGVTEELKGKDMMKWIGLMNNTHIQRMLCNGFAPAEKGEQNGKNRQGGYELCKGKTVHRF